MQWNEVYFVLESPCLHLCYNNKYFFSCYSFFVSIYHQYIHRHRLLSSNIFIFYDIHLLCFFFYYFWVVVYNFMRNYSSICCCCFFFIHSVIKMDNWYVEIEFIFKQTIEFVLFFDSSLPNPICTSLQWPLRTNTFYIQKKNMLLLFNTNTLISFHWNISMCSDIDLIILNSRST